MVNAIVSIIAGVVLGGLIWTGRVTEQLRGLSAVLIGWTLVYGLCVLILG